MRANVDEALRLRIEDLVMRESLLGLQVPRNNFLLALLSSHIHCLSGAYEGTRKKGWTK